MSTIFNTVDDVHFMNFFSNNYYSGVPVAEMYLFDENANFTRWIKNVVLDGHSIQNGNHLNFRLPNDGALTLANETLLPDSPITLNAMRFRIHNMLDWSPGDSGAGPNMLDPRSILGSPNSQTYGRYAFINTADAPNAAWQANVLSGQKRYRYINIGLAPTGTLASNNDMFSFGTKSNTTIAMTTFRLSKDFGGSLIDDFLTSGITVCGWMHNCIYGHPLPSEVARYFGVYMLSISHSGINTKHFNYRMCMSGGEKNVGGDSFYDLEPYYYDIVCEDGEYIPGLFLTDYVLVDENYTKLGKVDNRVVCLGRGTFELGRIYEVNNAFGRTGKEHWLCVTSATPTNYYPPKRWQSTDEGSSEQFRVWQTNELDWLLMRVYVDETETN